jgi:iron complex outermembrane receptor protein
MPSVAGCTPSPGSVICDAGSLRNEIDHNTPGQQDSELDNIGLDVAHQLTDDLTLSYKFGYRESFDNAYTDFDKTSRTTGGICPDPANQSDWCALDGAGLIPPGGYEYSNYGRYNEQTSHEITLVSDFDGQFNFVAGLYTRDGDEPYVARYFRLGQEGLNVDGFDACTGEGGRSQSLTIGQEVTTGGVAFSCPGTPEDMALAYFSNVPGSVMPMTGNLKGQRVTFMGHTSFETNAVYFNGDWTLNDQWKVLGGIRYDEDVRTHEQNDVQVGYDGTNSITGERYGYNLWIFRNANVDGFEWKNDRKWKEVTWTVGLEHYPSDDQMIYARISKGARAGGFAGFGQMNAEPWGTFDSETLINYEVGLKGLFLDQKLQLESAIFFMDYKDHWVNSERLREPNERVLGESLFEGEMNVIQGTWIAGLEVSGAYTLTDTLTIRGFYNYLDSEVGDFTTAYCCDETAPTVDIDFTLRDGTTITQSIKEPEDFGGNRLPLMAEHKYALTALWSPEVPTGSLTLLTTYSFTDTRDPDLSNLDRFELPSYTRLDARAIWDSPDEDYSVTVYVKNVLDEIAVQQFRPIETGGGSVIRGSLTDEREFGMSVMWQIY